VICTVQTTHQVQGQKRRIVYYNRLVHYTLNCHMANRIHRYVRCLQWSVSGGARICCQNCSSPSRRGVKRLQSFADFQGSDWKLASFLQWPSNVVTALANGPRLLSQAGSLSMFSFPYLTLSLPWLMELGGGRQLVSGGLQQKPGKVASVSGASKTSNINISAPRRARAFLEADLNTWQGRLQI
jgi:hypothetical protein